MSAETDFEQIRQLVGEDWPPENVVPMVAGLVAAVPVQAAEIERLKAELDGWRHRFCPAGKHYKGSSIQSRLNPETRQMERSTFETYRCWECAQDKRRAECPHDGDILPTKMFMGYGWECSLCRAYFGHVGDPHDEALAAIRAELAATPGKAPR